VRSMLHTERCISCVAYIVQAVRCGGEQNIFVEGRVVASEIPSGIPASYAKPAGAGPGSGQIEAGSSSVKSSASHENTHLDDGNLSHGLGARILAESSRKACLCHKFSAVGNLDDSCQRERLCFAQGKCIIIK